LQKRQKDIGKKRFAQVMAKPLLCWHQSKLVAASVLPEAKADAAIGEAVANGINFLSNFITTLPLMLLCSKLFK